MANQTHVRGAAVAQRLIRLNGRNVDLLKFDTIPADNAKPWRGPADGDERTNATSFTIKAVFIEPQSAEEFGMKITNEELIRVSDKILMLASNDIPTGEVLDDYISMVDSLDSLESKIDSIRTFTPGETPILHFILLKR